MKNREIEQKITQNLTDIEIKNICKDIADNMPELQNLTAEQLQAVAKMVIAEKLKDDLKRGVNLAKIDYTAEKKNFLDTVSKTGSNHTKRAYSNAFTCFEDYCNCGNINPLELYYKTADEFINSLNKVYAPASTRQKTAVVSAFFSYLERRYPESIINPFRNTKARPIKKTMRECIYPSKKETVLLLKACEDRPQLYAQVFMMINRGLRVGAFENMQIYDGTFKTTSKGKEIQGKLSDEIIQVLKKTGCIGKTPFTDSTGATAEAFRKRSLKLYEQGKIRAVYSVHDLRHYFAVTEYAKDKDIYRVSKLLFHSSISVTEIYLKGLSVIE